MSKILYLIELKVINREIIFLKQLSMIFPSVFQSQIIFLQNKRRMNRIHTSNPYSMILKKFCLSLSENILYK